MKKIVILLALISNITYSQDVPIKTYNLVMWDKHELYFSVEKDSIFTINDSLKTIKQLYKTFLDNQKEIEKLNSTIEKSVEWSNTVPDYFRNNKKWYSFLSDLRKKGYKQSKVKK
jgi:hypothetical protein